MQELRETQPAPEHQIQQKKRSKGIFYLIKPYTNLHTYKYLSIHKYFNGCEKKFSQTPDSFN